MYTTHYPLTEAERTSFDLVIGNNQVDWDDLSARRQDAVNHLIRKYPDIAETAVWTGSDLAASTGVPLSQMSQLPDTLSEVSTNKAWEAYNKTKGSWEDFSKPRQQQQGYPEPQTPSPTLQRPAQHEASRQRFTAALHAAVDAEGDIAKYKAQLQQLGGGFDDDNDEEEEEEDEDLEGQLLETAQKSAAPKSNAKKRRERKKRLSEGRMAKEN
ncbi:hypothetical protein CEP54_014589 [Fusarium duplospermum]|uniref:Uncharacterized protein n=1 Tax=Fusarium duplospermum TaxID=1325734 RepID=A0A428NV98_9HYPO|nr:hypothetical protein CEP54_014589 [Fusarium duplospermum]